MATELLRPELDRSTLPERIARLRTHRGYPVPWFVDDIDGVPEFRVMDRRKWVMALSDQRCWVCGERLGRHRVFVIGPMCGINMVTSEPPCHADCATWSAKNCPFLSRPHAVRRDETDLLAHGATHGGGVPIMRNPGVALLWWTRDYRTFRPESGDTNALLIQLGKPEQVRWYAEGRAATRAEVVHSIETGLPALLEAADMEHTSWRSEAAHREITERLLEIQSLYPEE